MRGRLRRLRDAIGRIAWLVPVRRSLRSLLVMPWEQQPVFGLDLASYFPEFKRGFENEPEAVEDLLIVRDHTMTKYDRCITLHGLVRHLESRRISGAFVECGVWKGGSTGLMALANRRYGRERRDLHLFDAWGDWPDPTDRDGTLFSELKAGKLVKADSQGAYDACRDLLERRIGYPIERLHYHRGLFEQTLPDEGQAVGSIALLRLDADWYEGTRLCLETFYDGVAAGGLVVIDDYGYSEGCRKAVDEFLQERQPHALLHFSDYSCRYFVKDGGSNEHRADREM